MNIVSVSDEAFAPHFAACLHSAAFHNPRASFYLLDCGIEKRSLENLSHLAHRLDVTLQVMAIDTDTIDGLPTTPTLPRAAYAKLLIPMVLAKTIPRAIYIDADCIVTEELSELWNIDLEGLALAAVVDDGQYEERHSGLRFPIQVNTGVMVMDLSVWRDNDIPAKAIRFAVEHQEMVLADQTAINAVCQSWMKIIPYRWNYLCGVFPRIGVPEKIPSIIHYCGEGKPWVSSEVPFAVLYGRHRGATPFPFTAPPKRRMQLRTLFNLVGLRRKHWEAWRLMRKAGALSRGYLKALKLISH